MAQTFRVDVGTISKHQQNIFKTNELDENSVFRKIRITAPDVNKNHISDFDRFLEEDDKFIVK